MNVTATSDSTSTLGNSGRKVHQPVVFIAKKISVEGTGVICFSLSFLRYGNVVKQNQSLTIHSPEGTPSIPMVPKQIDSVNVKSRRSGVGGGMMAKYQVIFLFSVVEARKKHFGGTSKYN